ncbi:hypothetical protein ACFWWT_41740 [Streptomyces sp. NPDC058676]|uniref:hypothetical protein n=1 Tax=unclassified Streptomyces TaxID=2593676 RepID=UPI0036481367
MNAAHGWWTAALDTGLPPGALSGAGDFAERAAGHPRSPMPCSWPGTLQLQDQVRRQ